MSRGGPGPDHEPAAWSMGNSLYQWMTTYYPTFKLSQMRQSQLQMEHYRQQALELEGQPAADPLALLTGAPPPALPPLPADVQADGAEVAQQLQQLQQQQNEVLEQLAQLQQQLAQQPGQAAQPAALAAVKPEPEWPVVSDDEWDGLVIDLCGSDSDYSSAQSMES